MKFVIKKDDLFNGIKIVERATSIKTLQPVFSNIFIEAIDKSTVKLVATDLDLTVITLVDAQVEEEGKITLPAKTLNEIVSKLGNKLITFEVEEEDTTVNITCQSSKFEIIGISAKEFPHEIYREALDEKNSFEIDQKPLTKAIRQAGFAAASYETSNLLSGIVCHIEGQTLEVASTDGNRLARVREKIENKENKVYQLVIPAKNLNEYLKVSSYIEDEKIKVYMEPSRIFLKSSKTTIISRLLNGQYPKYNQLIPTECPKEAIVNVSQLISALERVSIMISEKNNIVKMNFADNELVLSGNTPDSGNSEEKVEINYTSEPLLIAFNYKYVLEALKNIDSEEVRIGLNTGLSATVLRPNDLDDFVSLIMPVQIK